MASKLDHTSEYVIIMPAYNEAQSIGHALDAVRIAANQTSHRLARVLICLNGCTDDTERVINRFSKTLPITILKSQQGYRTALNKLFHHAKRHYFSAKIVKLDADTVVQPDALSLLLNQLDMHPSLQIVGGHPLPRFSPTLRPVQRVFARTFSLRSLYPKAQIAVDDVQQYHPYAVIDPQPGLGDDEMRLKPYFHGRIWVARSSAILSKISDTIIGDDVYLAACIYRSFGPGSIRVLYAANVLCAPNHSPKRHWMVYKRIHEDKLRVESIPQYTKIQQAQHTTLDWRYIFKEVKPTDRLLFVLYWAISCAEELTFRHTTYRDSFWHYKNKELL